MSWMASKEVGAKQGDRRTVRTDTVMQCRGQAVLEVGKKQEHAGVCNAYINTNEHDVGCLKAGLESVEETLPLNDVASVVRDFFAVLDSRKYGAFVVYLIFLSTVRRCNGCVFVGSRVSQA